MRVPFNWLKEFTPVSASAPEVAEGLTNRGLEVEGMEEISPLFTGVCVGEIVEIARHPSAEKLSLCRVEVAGEVLPIVCGAPNIGKGQKVPVAMPGGRLADGTVIEKRRLRGMESSGMLCSERELGLSDDHSGIFVLPAELRTGEPLDLALEIPDYVLDVNVPPNRGDCQSILGIAREVASIFHLSITLPSFTLDEKADLDDMIRLAVRDADACPRYVLRMIRGISIVRAPFWMRSRITKAGMRPINSIVDVTNYVMLELGQPLHAFDYARIRSQIIEARVAGEKAVFRTLDGSDRMVEKGDILICDGAGPVAIAGVMGGENSEISADTSDVALESAFFNPLLIRRTARRLDLRSEASARFEKGIDIEGVDYAARRAIELMQRTSGGEVLRGSVEVYERMKPRSIGLGLARTQEIIGTTLSREQVVLGLDSLGIHPTETEGDAMTFSIPSFRHDLNEYCDLIEEVARIIGYDAVPASRPVSSLLSVSPAKRDSVIDSAKEYLTACGFFEVINYGFFNSANIEKFGLDADDSGSDERASCVPILNPISKELGVMRTFLAAGVLENIAYNSNRGTKNLRIFEIGKVFFGSDASVLPRESMHLCCAISGREREYFWRDPSREFDFFDLKGVLEDLFDRFNLPLRLEKTDAPFLEPAESADLVVDGAKVGWMGALRDSVRGAYDVTDRAWCAELDLDVITGKGTGERTYRPIPRYPAVIRDFSFYVDDSIPVGELVERIRNVSPLIVSVGIFDIFKKEERSISFRVVFQSYEDTLTDESVNSLQQIIIDGLTRTEGITLRR
ncbi:MAG: phenylalanine--tRNA ligase subunit beta [Syntrophorhabdales bacterium]|jgi:phenylalanyl-tRNA synthetase beta chain